MNSNFTPIIKSSPTKMGKALGSIFKNKLFDDGETLSGSIEE
jgi:hypothetical protein